MALTPTSAPPRPQKVSVKRRREIARRRRALWRGTWLLATVAALVTFLYVASRATDATMGIDAATASGEALPPAGGDPDPAVGSEAPTVTGRSFEDEVVAIGNTGEPQAVLFLAHWCPHCRDEVPAVVGWVADGLVPEGVRLVAVSTLHDPARPNWPPDEWLEREEWPGEVLVDPDRTAADAWGLAGTPMWVFVDAQGVVTARHSGVITRDAFVAETLRLSGT